METIETLEATVKKKQQSKYNTKLENEVQEWIEQSTNKKLDSTLSFQENLKSGLVLCELLNVISPGLVKKINNSGLAFKQMENIASFVKACQRLGFDEEQLFDTIDLFENKDPNKVIICLDKLRKKHIEYQQNPSLLILRDIPSSSLSVPSSLSSALSPQSSTRRVSTGKSSSPSTSHSISHSSPSTPPSSSSSSISPSSSFSSSSPSSSKRMSPIAANLGEKAVSKPVAENKKAAAPSVQNLGADVALKEELKYNPELERMAIQWICDVLEEKYPQNTSFAEFLKNGINLCRLINVIQPGSIPKIHTGNIAFQKIENIGSYIKAIKKLGLERDLFDIIDLFEEKNINYVINHIHVLAKFVAHLPTYKGPLMAQEDLLKTRNLFSSNLTNNIVDFNSDDGATISEQQRDLIGWVNSILTNCPVPSFPIRNLSSNLRSGKVIMKLLEDLTHHTVGGGVDDPLTMWHCMSNAHCIIRFLTAETCETVSMCSARDIASGNAEKISLLLEYI